MTATTVDLGNGETVSRGVFSQADGTWMAKDRDAHVAAWLAARSASCGERETSCLDGSLSSLSWSDLCRERIAAASAIPRAEYVLSLRGERPTSAASARYDRAVGEMRLRGRVLADGGLIVRTALRGVCS